MRETGRRKNLGGGGNGWSPQDCLWQEVPAEQPTVTGSKKPFFPESSAAVSTKKAPDFVLKSGESIFWYEK